MPATSTVGIAKFIYRHPTPRRNALYPPIFVEWPDRPACLMLNDLLAMSCMHNGCGQPSHADAPGDLTIST